MSVAATWAAPRRSWAASVVAMLFALTYLGFAVAVAPDGALGDPRYASAGERALGVVLYLVFSLLVLAGAHWLRRATLSTQRLRVLESERQGVTNDAALLGERSRLARDLHDVVAHHVSLIAVRAETAPYTVPDLSPGARVVLADIADDSRKALDELRGVLGIRVVPTATHWPRSRRPPTCLSWRAGAAAAGQVSLVGKEHLDLLGATTGYVAYRVVQEALTNARRHAPGVPVAVEVTPGGGGLWIRVTNRADGVGAVVPGRGLTGMRERVEAVGGSLSTDLRGGDFVVEAVLPR